MIKEFEKFIKSQFGLEILTGGKAIFRSKKNGIQGLLEFIKKKKKSTKNLTPLRNKFLTGLTVFDKKVGNAVALLCVYLKAREVYGVIGSKTAEKTLKENKIKIHFLKTIPNIINKDETDICPMERMSLSKTPEEFLDLLKTKGIC